MIVVGWVIGLAIGGYVVLMLVLIVLRTVRDVWRRLRAISAVIVSHAAEVLADLIMDGIGLAAFFAAGGILWLLQPVIRLWRNALGLRATAREGQETADRETPVAHALKVMGLSDGVTMAEVKDRKKKLMGKVHPDAGGTDWLAQQVNGAFDILKKEAMG
jgi:hypothetical protein